MNRRAFLSTSSALLSCAALPAWAVAAAPRLLILIELRGGNDGLNTVIPIDDGAYFDLRPRLAFKPDAVVRFEGAPALHPSLAPLEPLWRDGQMAILQGVGYPEPNLSHFRSIEIWDTASDSQQFLHTGWLTRTVDKQSAFASQSADGVVIGAADLGPLAGGARAVALNDPARFARQARLASADGVAARGALAQAAVGRRIDHSGTIRRWDVEEEVLPYEPLLDWGYLGTGRHPDAARKLLSIVPEFGCPYQEDALVLPQFAGVEAQESPSALLKHLDLSPRAVDAMRPFLANTGGCSFCVFRFQDYTLLDVERTVDLLLTQVRHLQARVGASGFSLQTENPFRILRPFLTRLGSEGIAVERLAIRTIATILLAKADEFRRALAIARTHGVQIVLQQIGFENFDQEHLDLFNKGISVAENRRAARLLGELKAEFGDVIEPFSGHGLILFDPWTTLESLARNVAAIEADAPYLLPAIGLQSKLVFYDPFNPIFRRARNDGLVIPSPHDYGWDFRFADTRTADFVQMCLALERHLVKRLGFRAGDEQLSSRGYRRLENELFRRALDRYRQDDGNPEGLRAGFYELAGWIDGEVARAAAG